MGSGTEICSRSLCTSFKKAIKFLTTHCSPKSDAAGTWQNEPHNCLMSVSPVCHLFCRRAWQDFFVVVIVNVTGVILEILESRDLWSRHFCGHIPLCHSSYCIIRLPGCIHFLIWGISVREQPCLQSAESGQIYLLYAKIAQWALLRPNVKNSPNVKKYSNCK